MKPLNYIKFLFNPKGYIKALVKEHNKSYLERIKSVQDLQDINDVHQDDVFIVGYPKSGNTWMQSMIAALNYGIDSHFLPDSLAQDLVPDVHYKKFYRRYGNISFFKSHSLPNKDYRKVIYLVRDGRDAMISYYHFKNRFEDGVSLKDMIEFDKGLFPCSWRTHVKKWRENPYGADILYVKYEDLLSDTRKEIDRILDFIGLDREEEFIDRVIEGNSFANMKIKAKKFKGLGQKNWVGDKGVNFFRSGEKGGYKKEFPQDLLLMFNEKSKEELTYFNYKIT